MTKIKATVKDDHFHFSFIDHAGDSRVCTAISTLICTLSGALLNDPEAVRVDKQIGYGDTTISWIAKGERAREDAYFTLIGLLQLEAEYPESVKVEQNIFS